MKFVLKSSLFAVVAIALASLTSCNVFASEVVWEDVSLYRAIDTPSTRCANGWSNTMCPVVDNNQPSGVNYIYWQDSFDNLTYGEYWFEVFVSFSDYGTGQAPLVVMTPSSINGATVSFEQVSSTTRGSSTTRIYRYLGHWQGNLDIQPYNVGLYSTSNWVNTGAYGINYVAWYKKNANSDATNQQIVNAINANSAYLNSINSGIQSLNTGINSLNSGLNSVRSDVQGVAEQEERVADVAEDEYNKTIQDEQTASQGANGFSFNFSLPNPMSLFNLAYDGNGCYSTPTIDRWLHLEGDWKSPHCPLIPANIRNTLTPVVSVIVSLSTLLVIIRWVSGSAVDVAGNIGSIQSKGDKK